MDSIYFYQMNITCMAVLTGLLGILAARKRVLDIRERRIAMNIVLIFLFHLAAMLIGEWAYDILRMLFFGMQLAGSFWLTVSGRMTWRKAAVYHLVPLVSFAAELMIKGAVFLPAAYTISVVVMMAWMQQEMICIDALTGLNNRSAYVRYMRSRMESARDTDEIFVAVVDIDGFKKINDTYGHIEGDRCLKQVAEVLERACGRRPGRLFLARYGGDEFVIAGTGRERNEEGKLQAAIESCMEEFYPDAPVSLSMGAVSLPAGSLKRYDELFERADQAMYQNKRKKKKKS